MSPQQWTKIQELFQRAVEVPLDQQRGFLIEACDGDENLRGEVESLLAHDQQSDSLLSIPAKPQEVLPTITGYRIDGVLGQGGMGIVYRATQLALNRTVALKVLPAMIASASPSVALRFRREASAAAKLHHTNIVPIYDFGQSADACYYAMELVEGVPLDEVIKRLSGHDVAHLSPNSLRELMSCSTVSPASSTAAISTNPANSDSSGSRTLGSSSGKSGIYFRIVAQWIAEVAEALHHAHEQGIIHRDVKPSNLILSKDGRVMVSDFGLAKSEGDPSMTTSGSLIGTVRYLSPEQAMAKRIPVDRRTDIYSLGATMYEMLTFRPAFPGDERSQVLAAIIQRDPARLRSHIRSIPAELETICLKTLEKNPAARYATSQELASDLRRFLNDVAIVAKPPTYFQLLGKFTRRHRPQIVTTLVILVLVAISMSILSMVRTHYGNDYFEQGEICFKKGDYDCAETNFRIASEYGHPKAYDKSVELGTRIGRTVNPFPQRGTPEAEAFVNLALRATEKGQWREAEAWYEHALAIEPLNVAALGNYAIMKKEQVNATNPKNKQQLLEDALHLTERAIEIDQNIPELWNINAVLLKKLERYDEAIASIEAAIALEPRPALLINLGNLMALKNDFVGAEGAYQQAVKIDSGEPGERCEAWRQLAAIQHAMGNSDHLALAEKANNCLWEAAGRPDADALLLMARIALDRGDLQTAKQYLYDASNAGSIVLEEKIERIQAMIAWREGDAQSAIRYAQEALTLEDVETVNFLLIALGQARMSDKTEAQQAFDSAIKSWPPQLKERRFWVTADKGILWFDSAEEFDQLKREAEKAIAELN